jgi:CheY-like chemotaxis protein
VRHIPALAVTALAMVGDREKLLRPASTAISASRSSRTPLSARSSLFKGGELTTATILIVDDHVLNREFLMTLLATAAIACWRRRTAPKA